MNSNTYYRYITINNSMLRMSLHQVHISLKNGVTDITISFTNKLSEFTIFFIKLNTNFEVHQNIECLDFGGSVIFGKIK